MLPPNAPPSDEGSETLTFVIADVRGYTRFTQERGDAEAAQLARAFAELARDTAEARGGHVIELRGDEALAVFSSPAQAVRAATELVAVCAEETEARPDLPLLVGIGIDTGEAVPVEGGYRGAALNTAARLCSHAVAGQVLVTARLAEFAGDVPGVRFEARGIADLKGFQSPVELIEAVAEERLPSDGSVGMVAPEPPVTAIPSPGSGVETPLVGRERELAWLRGTWRQARRGNGRVVFVSGPAGIGKSRLAAELADHVAATGISATYAGAGGAGAALAVSALRETVADPSPTLLVLDDLDVLGEQLDSLLNSLLEAVEDGRTLVVGLTRDPSASPVLARLVQRADAAGDGHRALLPLDAREVREIAQLYAGDDTDDVPLESIVRASGGTPARVHELMSEWAAQEATRRLGAAAQWLSSDRHERAADLAFANNFIGLKLARLYADDGPRVELVREACPYKGLASFEESDARFFFGREQLVGELAARTVGTGLLAVVGASGSGKTSVIAAGLLPSLRAGLLPGSERWRQVSIRPGEHPLAELESALATSARDGERVVLVVDQFEEVFTASQDERERSNFIDRLVLIAGDPERAIVVLGLRGDFYGHIGAYPGLARLLTVNQVLVGPMTQDELRRAVELPARRAGFRVEAALTASLVADVGDEPGGLPLLSTALVELWGAQTDGWLRLEAHERLGGVRGAVARLAERAYESLTTEQRAAARHLLLRLVATSDEGVLSRRRVNASELDLTRDQVMDSVVGRLTEDRLLTADEDTVEVSHEALLREWPRLERWLLEDAQGRELREHLTRSARQWESAGRETGELYSGARLSATLDWASGREQELNELERAFLAAGRAEAERELTRQRRQNRRLKGLLAGVGILLLLAVTAGIFALALRNDAKKSATAATAQRLGAQALVEDDLDLSLLLARQGVELDESVETRSTLLKALQRSPAAIGIMRGAGERLAKVVISPDGLVLAVRSENEVIRFDARTYERLGNPITVSGRAFGLAFSRDGRTLAAGGQDDRGDGFVDLVDLGAQTARVRKTVPGRSVDWLGYVGDPPVLVTSELTFSPDGSEGDVFLVVRDADSAEELGRSARTGLGVAGGEAVAAGPDGQLLVSSVDQGTTTLLDVRTLEPIRTFSLLGWPAIGPNGTNAAIGDADGGVTLLDLRTGAKRQMTGTHTAEVRGASFTPDGMTLVTIGGAGDVIVWDVATGVARETFEGHAGRVSGLAMSPDARTLFTSSLDGSMIAWDLEGRRRAGRPFTFSSAHVSSLGRWVSPDGETLALAASGGKITFWSTATLEEARPSIQLDTSDLDLAFSPDGQRLAITTRDGEFMLLDLASGQLSERRQFANQQKNVSGFAASFPELDDFAYVTYSPEGDVVATGGTDGRVVLWEGESGARAKSPLELGRAVFELSFSPNGQTVVMALDGGTVEAWDLESRQRLRSIETGEDFVVSAQLSPDGDLLATGGADGLLRLWDARTGRLLDSPLAAVAGFILHIEFAPDGRTLLTSGTDGAVSLWDVRTRKLIGSPLVTAADEWNTAPVLPDGRRMVSVSAAGRAVVWDIDPEMLKSHACSIASRILTEREWDFYLPDREYDPACR